MRIDHKESYKDFGNQFVVDSKLDDYWGSKTNFKDMVKPFNLNQIKNKICMDVGSGSGRILKNLIKFRPKKIFSIEPSKAINVAKANLKKHHKKIEFQNIKGENIKLKNKIDYCKIKLTTVFLLELFTTYQMQRVFVKRFIVH